MQSVTLKSRTSKSIFNIITSVGGHALVTILGFVSRTIFIRYLAIELLGVNGLFSSILQIFSLADLGFATAITYALYKPLSENDEQKISVLMRYYAKFYTFVGCFILLIGLALLPFLQYLINGFEDINITLNELRLYFFIFLISTVSTYFIAYKRTLLISDQKKYLINLVNICVSIVSRLALIFIIIAFSNFTLYLIFQVLFVYIENIIINIIVDKKYNYLKLFKNEKLSNEEKKALFINIGALFVTKFSSVFTTGIIAVIISRIIGLREVGLYSNYRLVIVLFTTILGLIFDSVTASVGNFVSTECKEAQKLLFKKILYINSFFAILFLSGFVFLFNDFIIIWLGPNLVYDNLLPVVLSIHLFFYLLRYTPWLFINACGLYKHYFYKSFFEIIMFLCLAIPGAIYFGISGIIAAQLISFLIAQIPFEILVVSKYVLAKKTTFYYFELFKYFIIAIPCLSLSFLVYTFIPFYGIIGFIIKTFLIILIVTSLFTLSTFKTIEFKYYFNLLTVKIKNNTKS